MAYNPFHDQLLATGATDGRVDLWRLSSVSSAPLLELGDELDDGDGGAGGDGGDGAPRRREPKLAPDAALRVHEDLDDTVVGVAWSAHSAWAYASASYTGRVAVAQVPPAEKYKILL